MKLNEWLDSTPADLKFDLNKALDEFGKKNGPEVQKMIELISSGEFWINGRVNIYKLKREHGLTYKKVRRLLKRLICYLSKYQ